MFKTMATGKLLILATACFSPYLLLGLLHDFFIKWIRLAGGSSGKLKIIMLRVSKCNEQNWLFTEVGEAELMKT